MFEINNDVILVKGFKNAAIYDFNHNLFFSINDVAYSIIERCIIHMQPLENDIEKSYVESLKEHNLISDSFSPRPYQITADYSIKLNFAWLELTSACNYHCVHCYEGEEHICSNAPLSLSKWKKILKDLKFSGCSKIQFTGGEPCLFQGFASLLNFAHSLCFDEISIFTNTSLLTEDLMALFKDLNIRVRFSLYGHSANIHDAVTRQHGSFEKTVVNVKKMLALGIHVEPEVVILRENEECIENIKDFIAKMGLPYKGFDVIRPVYGGTQKFHSPTNPDVLYAKHRKKPSFRITKARFLRAFDKNTCWYGKFAIESNGNVMPCIFTRNISYGNLTVNSVKDILCSPSLRENWFLDFSKVDVCKDCEFRFACKDCRSLGMSSCNNIKSKNPRCLYNPYTGTWEK